VAVAGRRDLDLAADAAVAAAVRVRQGRLHGGFSCVSPSVSSVALLVCKIKDGWAKLAGPTGLSRRAANTEVGAR